MKDKLILTLAVGLTVLLVSWVIYMAITNPYQYQGYDLQTPPVYSPYPAA